MIYPDEPETSSSTKNIHSLEDALKSNGIQVPDGAIRKVLDQNEWIYPSQRVEDMLEMLNNKDQLYSVFNSQHHIYSSTQLFHFLAKQRKKVSVVYGHKAQGKSQFLYFVFRLLQAMGEKVLFLDRTMLPLEFNNRIHIKSVNFCGHFWRDFLQIEGDVQDKLDTFYNDASPKSFGEFLFSLLEYVESSKTRVWIIVDEVVLFEKFPIQLPKEQDLGPFNWIITGSAGIGSWVGKRHLEKLVFDLPLFTQNECLDFATRLSNQLSINLEDTIGVPSAGIDDWLEERFGGVVGYIAELLLEVSKGNLVSQYLSSLDDRMKKIISNVAERRHLSEEQLSSVWLKDMKSGSNKWNHLRDAGLCGSQSPRGIIFTLILQCLYKYAPGEDLLSLVSTYRSMFSTDPGLDGCLMELEEILKLKASRSLKASLLTCIDQGWIVEKSIELPPIRLSLNVLVYREDLSTLASFDETSKSKRSSWHLIEVSSGFDVIDVVLVDNTVGSPAIYGIQITRSVKPFAKHHTFWHCSFKSTHRLNKLWRAISNHFKFDDTVKKFYVMLAPNCEGGRFKPPARNSSEYYFSPTSVITEYNPSDLIRADKTN